MLPWSAKLPDMNCIKNVWSHLKLKLNRRITANNTVEDVTCYFQEEWRPIPGAGFSGWCAQWDIGQRPLLWHVEDTPTISTIIICFCFLLIFLSLCNVHNQIYINVLCPIKLPLSSHQVRFLKRNVPSNNSILCNHQCILSYDICHIDIWQYFPRFESIFVIKSAKTLWYQGDNFGFPYFLWTLYIWYRLSQSRISYFKKHARWSGISRTVYDIWICRWVRKAYIYWIVYVKKNNV